VSVTVVHWNPRRPVAPGLRGRALPVRRRVNNFGDLIGPLLVREILHRRGIDPGKGRRGGRLLTVGSILHFARSGDTVWGSGINGKVLALRPGLRLDVRAVRGPVTQRLLGERGIEAPSVYGDPGLLWGTFWPRDSYRTGERRRVAIVPNLHDWPHHRGDPRAISPRGDVHRIIGQIAGSDLVVASSLHGLVVAESFGIPARLVRPGTEPLLKYCDYYEGTGRPGFTPAATVDEAVDLGGEPPPVWDRDGLLAAFPIDLWSPMSP
jgi:pyruvyltransferase